MHREDEDGFVAAPEETWAPEPIIPGGGGSRSGGGSEESLGFALIAGGLAALAGALVWTGIAGFGGQRIGYIALGVGFLVGWVVRKAGRGTSWVFGAVAALLTLASCALGMVLSFAVRVALAEAGSLDAGALERILAVLLSLSLEDALRAAMSPADGIFTLIATYQAFQLGYTRPAAGPAEELPT